MILSNADIVDGLDKGLFKIHPLAGRNPSKPPFNSSAVDLRLHEEIVVPDGGSPIQIDLRHGSIAHFVRKNSRTFCTTAEQPFCLKPRQFVLARTLERVDFPLNEAQTYSARVEGKSSLARCGILVHFTAPTIHAGFEGSITLEIINLGPNSFLLPPEMFICQLIVEEVKGRPVEAPNQFKGQSHAAGVV